MKLLRRLLGDRAPADFTGALDDEHVLADAATASGPLVATSRGLWVPAVDGTRRIGWHMISKAGWRDGSLSVVEADETGRAGDALLIADRRAVSYSLRPSGKLPKVVRERVNASISAAYHRELPGGGAWFVQRKLLGVAAPILQVRAEPGTDPEIVADIAREAAAKLANPQR
ncbi:MAG: hypothetical protein GEU86_09665 [Actinophytocola sp.]|nr:hypothetical protein [Actinophytocola sp.]